jgi:uncharacterized metal-binding protein
LPSGVAHRRIAFLVLIAVLSLTAKYYDSLVRVFGPDPVFEFALLFCLSFLVGTTLLSPDLDLSDSDPTRSWGVVQVIWRPYARVFRHRGMSHMPLVGTFTRIGYLGCVTYVISALVQSFMGWHWRISVFDLSRLWEPQSLCIFAGLACSDVAHLIADRFFSR